MKLTVVGDPHAQNSNLDTISQLCSQVESLGNPVIWLGDMLDTKEVVRGKSLNAWISYFFRSELDHYILVGNHDWFNLECEDHSLRALGFLHHSRVIDSLVVLNCPTPIALMPYRPTAALAREDLAKIPPNAAVFGHFEVKTFDFGNGLICESGLEVADFAQFPAVVSGHFHKYQNAGNFTYLGTPFSHSFGETDQTKYLGIFDTETQTMELLPTEFPSHRTLTIDLSEPPQALGSVLREFLRPKDFHRIVLAGPAEEVKELHEAIQTLDFIKEHNVKFIFKFANTFASDPKSSGISEEKSNLVQFSTWAAAKLAPEEIQAGLELLREASK